MSNKQENINVLVGSRTDVGCVRDHNEDALSATIPLLVVADGVGGQEAGEVASSIAVETMKQTAPRFADAEKLKDAVQTANQAVIKGMRDGVGREGMATTLTATVIDGSELVVAQVGDSRAYLMRGGELFQITHDHSLVAMLVESGQITEEEARNHPQRSTITRALGSEEEVEVDLYNLSLISGDIILICSDGLCAYVDKQVIEKTLQEVPDPQTAADDLVEEAKLAGGYDNISVIVARIGNTENHAQAVKNKKKHAGIIIAIIAVVLIVCACLGGGYAIAKNSAYLIEEDGYVSLYSGRLDKIAGIDLSWFEYKSDVDVSELPEIIEEKLVQGIQFDSKDEAEAALDDYRSQISNSKEADDVSGSTMNQNLDSSSAGTGDDTSGSTINQNLD